MDSMGILDRIERGEISIQEGIALIQKLRNPDKLTRRKGNFMKIKVSDKENKFSFAVPMFVLSAGLSLTRFAASMTPENHIDDNAKKALDVFKSLDKKDIKRLITELRKCKSMDFIEVHSKDSDVSIRIV